jgi:hypothetical protein
MRIEREGHVLCASCGRRYDYKARQEFQAGLRRGPGPLVAHDWRCCVKHEGFSALPGFVGGAPLSDALLVVGL